eukprot:gb/GECG01009514.1/.p1 GENE.gb/GECG01009514.1/~~gb/GECG01009514.1/.p1  ORF type:complete len:121 (+),score=16.13 gb/GECG01009514.1/:1-363(+)
MSTPRGFWQSSWRPRWHRSVLQLSQEGTKDDEGSDRSEEEHNQDIGFRVSRSALYGADIIGQILVVKLRDQPLSSRLALRSQLQVTQFGTVVFSSIKEVSKNKDAIWDILANANSDQLIL